MAEKQLQEMMDEVTRGKGFDNKTISYKYQMEEIKNGFKSGLSMQQVQFYADSKFDGWQMEQIRLGFENSLPMKQIQFYADSKFNQYQMEQIRKGFEYGLSAEQVQI